MKIGVALVFAAGISVVAAGVWKAASSPDAGAMLKRNSASMRAYIDPLTGELLPEAPAGQRLLPLPQLQPDNSKIEVLKLPGNMKGVRFHGQRQATVIATLQADGSVDTECLESTAELPDALKSEDKQ